MTLLINRFE